MGLRHVNEPETLDFLLRQSGEPLLLGTAAATRLVRLDRGIESHHVAGQPGRCELEPPAVHGRIAGDDPEAPDAVGKAGQWQALDLVPVDYRIVDPLLRGSQGMAGRVMKRVGVADVHRVGPLMAIDLAELPRAGGRALVVVDLEDQLVLGLAQDHVGHLGAIQGFQLLGRVDRDGQPHAAATAPHEEVEHLIGRLVAIDGRELIDEQVVAARLGFLLPDQFVLEDREQEAVERIQNILELMVTTDHQDHEPADDLVQREGLGRLFEHRRDGGHLAELGHQRTLDVGPRRTLIVGQDGQREPDDFIARLGDETPGVNSVEREQDRLPERPVEAGIVQMTIGQFTQDRGEQDARGLREVLVFGSVLLVRDQVVGELLGRDGIGDVASHVPGPGPAVEDVRQDDRHRQAHRHQGSEEVVLGIRHDRVEDIELGRWMGQDTLRQDLQRRALARTRRADQGDVTTIQGSGSGHVRQPHGRFLDARRGGLEHQLAERTPCLGRQQLQRAWPEGVASRQNEIRHGDRSPRMSSGNQGNRGGSDESSCDFRSGIGGQAVRLGRSGWAPEPPGAGRTGKISIRITGLRIEGRKPPGVEPS